MNKNLLLLTATLAAAGTAYGQSAIDAYRLSQPDMKGTARFMSMAGAFGALGGDLSSLSQNPAGIGVYRNGDVGFTLNLDCQNATSNSQGNQFSVDQTKFLLNNIGAVFTMRLDNPTFPNVNIGFTYNKGASFNRKYSGQVPRLNNSLSNYIAGITNSAGCTEADLLSTDSYNPWTSNAPWISTLGYQGFLINPTGTGNDTKWWGQWDNGTSGVGSFDVEEKGSVDEYNIAIGGNISNVVYWGMNFDITNIDYTMNSRWGETLTNAYLMDDQGEYQGDANWDLRNYYNVHGTGFNYQLGVILKPIQEFRIGFAFHTPTWYNLTEEYMGSIDYQYGDNKPGGADTNDGELGYNDVSFRTPWKVIASMAGVIGSKFILSFDYEWQGFQKMRYSTPRNSYGWGYDDWGWDPGYDDWGYWAPSKNQAPTRAVSPNDPYYDTNSDIEYYYNSTNTFRLGAEYRVTPGFSIRAGYSYTTSPFKKSVRDDQDNIYTSGTLPNYRVDNHTEYITCGLGYRYKQFYIDAAYVYKHMNSTYHAYTPDVDYQNNTVYPSPQSDLKLNNSQIVLTAGFRF